MCHTTKHAHTRLELQIFTLVLAVCILSITPTISDTFRGLSILFVPVAIARSIQRQMPRHIWSTSVTTFCHIEICRRTICIQATIRQTVHQELYHQKDLLILAQYNCFDGFHFHHHPMKLHEVLLWLLITCNVPCL